MQHPHMLCTKSMPVNHVTTHTSFILYHLYDTQQRCLTINIVQFNSLSVFILDYITLKYTKDFILPLEMLI